MLYKIKGKIADVSRWQGNIDWAQAATELDFALIRVQDNTIADVKLVRNIQGAEANDVPYGVYAYYRAKTVAQAIEEADRFYDRAMAAGARPTIWYIDVEKKTAKWATQRAAVSAYARQLRKRGAQRVGLYTYQAMYRRFKAIAAEFGDNWIARYGNRKTNLAGLPGKWPSHPCGLHQYTSGGRLAGVNGRVDLNRLTGQKPLSWYTGRQYETDETDLGQVRVTGLTAWVRSGPGKAWTKLGVVRKGIMLDRTGEDEDGWIGIEYKGERAYISEKMAKVV